MADDQIGVLDTGYAELSGPLRTRETVVALLACAVLVTDAITTTDAGTWKQTSPVRVRDVAWGAVTGVHVADQISLTEATPRAIDYGVFDALTTTDPTFQGIDLLLADAIGFADVQQRDLGSRITETTTVAEATPRAIDRLLTDPITVFLTESTSGRLGYISLAVDAITQTEGGSGTRLSPVRVRDVVTVDANNRLVGDAVTVSEDVDATGLYDFALDQIVTDTIATTNPGVWKVNGPIRVREFVRPVTALTGLVYDTVTQTEGGTGTRVSPLRVSEFVGRDLATQAIRLVWDTTYVREMVDPEMSVSGIPPGFVSDDIAVRNPGNAEHSGPIHLSEWVDRQLSTPTGIGQESAETPKVRESVVTRWDPNRKSVSDQITVTDQPSASPTAFVSETLYTRDNPGQSIPIAVREYVDRNLTTPIVLTRLVTEVISVANPTPTRSLVTLTQIDPVYVRESVSWSWAVVTPSGLAKDLSDTIAVRESTTAARSNAFLSASASPRLPVIDIVTSAVLRQVGLYGSASDTVTVRESHTEDLVPHRRLVFDPITVGESDRAIKGPTTGTNGRYAFRRRYGFRT